jgi:hypothetical protein
MAAEFDPGDDLLDNYKHPSGKQSNLIELCL